MNVVLEDLICGVCTRIGKALTIKEAKEVMAHYIANNMADEYGCSKITKTRTRELLTYDGKHNSYDDVYEFGAINCIL